MQASFDYLIVGCGFYGATFARVMADAGKRSLIVDRRPHIGGNCYTTEIAGIHVHRYGPHIFHTNDAGVWAFVNRFAEFNAYRHRGLVRYRDRLYSFPINLLTFHQLWGLLHPRDVSERLQRERVPVARPRNCEEWILSQVGPEIYEIFFRGYTAKHWNRDPSRLPAAIVRRIPMRLDYNDRYFSDRFEGIPVGGYTRLFENLLDHTLIQVETSVDYFAESRRLTAMASQVVYTGRIDEFYDFRFEPLDYRSLRFEDEIVQGDFQGAAVVNYTDQNVPFTRITEHKHLGSGGQHSVITREYPQDFTEGNTPYYPLRDDANVARYRRYRALAAASNVHFGGRLGSYQYYDMHQVIAQAMADARDVLGRRISGAGRGRRAA